MLITRTSILSGVKNYMDIPITEDELAAYERGDMLIQYAFPKLTDDQREFILSGITPEEWDRAFGSNYEI